MTARGKTPRRKPAARKRRTLSPRGRGQGEGAGGEGAGGERARPLGTRTITVWNRRVPIRVHAKGTGPALVFFHGPWGLTWGPFLDALARQFTVYAPEHPGTSPENPDAIQHVDHLWDLVLCYDELFEQLRLRDVVLAGHSFGAMVACEVAALQPARVKRLALIDPIGLWLDEAPVINWMLLGPAEMPAHVFHRPDGPAAQAMFAVPAEAEAGALARTRLTWAMGATGKFIWPIPDKGLKKRSHRITAPTLLLWGEHDRLVPRAYAKAFAERIADTRLQVVPGAGHAPHLEQPDATARVVQAFLKA